MSADARDLSDSFQVGEDRGEWQRQARNKRQRERYGPAHLRRRREFVRRFERGEIIPCFRCGGDLDYDSDWELDHDDRDPARSFPSHKSCNRAAPHRTVTSREW